MIIAGSRSITSEADYHRLLAAVLKFPKPTEIISGGAAGVDKMGERIAAEFGIPVVAIARLSELLAYTGEHAELAPHRAALLEYRNRYGV